MRAAIPKNFILVHNFILDLKPVYPPNMPSSAENFRSTTLATCLSSPPPPPARGPASVKISSAECVGTSFLALSHTRHEYANAYAKVHAHPKTQMQRLRGHICIARKNDFCEDRDAEMDPNESDSARYTGWDMCSYISVPFCIRFLFQGRNRAHNASH